MKIVHGDLRGANILISDDWTACLADFGLTGVVEDPASTTGGALTSTANHAGSLRWFAPELIAPTFFGCERFVRTTASDVYAFACVCLEVSWIGTACLVVCSLSYSCTRATHHSSTSHRTSQPC
jgi:serine/threonine protein kinase